MRQLLVAALFVLPLLAACRSDKGQLCQSEDDCGGSLICARDLGCGSDAECTGVCSDPCDTDEDCSGRERCVPETGTARNYCRFDPTHE